LPWSEGQTLEVPLHVSCKSQLSTAARQTSEDALKMQELEQQASVLEHCMLAFSLHVEHTQQLSLVALPQSYSSPKSMHPLPHTGTEAHWKGNLHSPPLHWPMRVPLAVLGNQHG